MIRGSNYEKYRKHIEATISIIFCFFAVTDLFAKLSDVRGSTEPIRAIPKEIKLDVRKVELGEQLFHEKKLSKNNTISCASCHPLAKGGMDNLKFSKGINGRVGDMNTPTVFNSKYNFKQFWDGRARSLKEQIDGPISHPKEMGSNWKKIISKLKRVSSYVSKFKEIYLDGITAENIKDAIATFEKSLITPNSRFDRYLLGDANALNEREKKGYQLFKSYGCIACHQGTGVGGNMFQKFGIVKEHPDKGKRGLYKVPSLRNVALTFPYFHDGSAPTLEEAVQEMAKYQLGRNLNEKDIQFIVDFLKTLTGEYKGSSFETLKGQ